MIEWTVSRKDPIKAFKFLNLAKNGGKVKPWKKSSNAQEFNYDSANNILKSMISAIIRNQIANSTMDHILHNRQEMRQQILEEMRDTVSGWGIYLETAEITDVKISSGSLFKDMQTEFRETNNKKALFERFVATENLNFAMFD